jgi:hypothetical protein
MMPYRVKAIKPIVFNDGQTCGVVLPGTLGSATAVNMAAPVRGNPFPDPTTIGVFWDACLLNGDEDVDDPEPNPRICEAWECPDTPITSVEFVSATAEA